MFLSPSLSTCPLLLPGSTPHPSHPHPVFSSGIFFRSALIKIFLSCRRRTKLSDQPAVGGWTDLRRDWRPRHSFRESGARGWEEVGRVKVGLGELQGDSEGGRVSPGWAWICRVQWLKWCRIIASGHRMWSCWCSWHFFFFFFALVHFLFCRRAEHEVTAKPWRLTICLRKGSFKTQDFNDGLGRLKQGVLTKQVACDHVVRKRIQRPAHWHTRDKDSK